MVGLRTQEDDRFVRFFEIIQEKAKQMDSVFFLDCAEGRCVFDDDMICTDCSGWLIPADRAQVFQKQYEAFRDNVTWEGFAAWATWEKRQTGIDIKLSML